VLCYFKGRTHDEAAAALQWPVVTDHSCLSRARALLRSRLARRGLAPAELIGTSLLQAGARVDVPQSLREATVGVAIKGTPVGAKLAALANFMIKSLFMTRFRMVGVGLALVVFTTGLGIVLSGAIASQPLHTTNPAPDAAVHPRMRPVERQVDPLPPHVRTRLGTSRFHAGNAIR
jgi:hypothetical protein